MSATTIIQTEDFMLHREGCQHIQRTGGHHYNHGTFETKEELLRELIRWEVEEMGEPDNEETYAMMLEMMTDNLKPCAKLK